MVNVTMIFIIITIATKIFLVIFEITFLDTLNFEDIAFCFNGQNIAEWVIVTDLIYDGVSTILFYLLMFSYCLGLSEEDRKKLKTKKKLDKFFKY